jgi:DNA-binding transcriptional MerR regulator
MTDVVHDPREAAARTGLTLDTLRYYEKEGLVGPITRRSGRRVYTDTDVVWIELITCLRAAGLGIADLREFTALLRDDTAAGDRAEFLRRRRAELRQRADAIAAAIGVLDSKIEHYG